MGGGTPAGGAAGDTGTAGSAARPAPNADPAPRFPSHTANTAANTGLSDAGRALGSSPSARTAGNARARREHSSALTASHPPSPGGFCPGAKLTAGEGSPCRGRGSCPAPAAPQGWPWGHTTVGLGVLKPASTRRLSTVPTAGPRRLSTVSLRVRRECTRSRRYRRGTPRQARPPLPPVRSRRPSRCLLRGCLSRQQQRTSGFRSASAKSITRTASI